MYERIVQTDLGLLLSNMITGRRDRSPMVASDSAIYTFNDKRTHAEVMEILETAVAFVRGAVDAGLKV
jgi:hypothetical protein